MSTFSDTFTQGGQTQLHKLHMIRQVMGSTFKVGLFIFGIAFALLMYFNHSWQEGWFLVCYGKAFVRINYMTFLPHDVFSDSWIYYVHGAAQTVSDTFLLSDPSHVKTFYYITSRFGWKLLYSGLISVVSFGILSWFWVVMGKKKKEVKILSGFECVEPKVIHKQILKSGASPYSIAQVAIPKNAEFQHVMVTGTTGAGKSNMIHQLLTQIREQGDQAIVVDTTGGIFSRFYDETCDLFLNPLDQRSANWNIWKEARSNHVIDEIAEAIIPDSRSMDSFWTQGARQLFAESIRYLNDKNMFRYDELSEMVLKLPLKKLYQRIAHSSAAALFEPSLEKTALSIRASLATHMRIFEELEDDENGLSLLNFAKENTNNWLFLSCQTDQRAYVKPLFSVWLSLLIKGMMARVEQNGARTWIIIDELASLNKLPSLLLGLAEIRKYGGCFVLGFQDLSQIEDLYGHSTAKTLSNLTGTKVLFRAVDTDVATRVSRFLGEQEKEEVSTSISYGAHQMRDGVNLNQQKQTKAVITASHVMLLKDLEAYIKYPGGFPISKLTFDYVKLDAAQPIYVAKPERVKKHHDVNIEEDHDSDGVIESDGEIIKENERSANMMQQYGPKGKTENRNHSYNENSEHALLFNLETELIE